MQSYQRRTSLMAHSRRSGWMAARPLGGGGTRVRLKDKLLLKQDDSNAAEAKNCFERTIEI